MDNPMIWRHVGLPAEWWVALAELAKQEKKSKPALIRDLLQQAYPHKFTNHGSHT